MKLSTILLIITITIFGIHPVNAEVPDNILRFLTPLLRIVPAVRFDGQTLITYNGSLFNIPDTGNAFFINFNYRSDTPPNNQTGLQNIISAVGLEGQVGYIASVSFNYTNSGIRANFFAGSADGKSWFSGTAANVVPYDSNWHSMTIDAVTNSQRVRFKMDEVEVGVTVNHTGQLFNFDWTKVFYWSVGGDPEISVNQPGAFYVGDMAQLYMDLTGILTVDNSNQFNSIIPGGAVKANGLGLDCIRPSSDIPQLCLTGSAGFFRRGPTSMSGYPAYEFATSFGDLITAKTAPCLVRGGPRACAPFR